MILPISASAGTGKTFTITEIVQNLLLSDDREELRNSKLKVNDIDILVKKLSDTFKGRMDLDRMAIITFTNKAASELLNKIQKAVKDRSKGNSQFDILLSKFSNANISTIHSFCLKILKKSITSIDMDPWFIDSNIEFTDSKIDEEFIRKIAIRAINNDEEIRDKFSQITKFPKDKYKDIDYAISLINNIIDKYPYLLIFYKNNEIEYSTKEAGQRAYYEFVMEFAEKVYESIRKVYLRENWISSNAILYETYKYLSSSKKSLQKIHEQFDLIIIDEFQDTDPLQWEIMKLINTNMILVGDTKQSIYRFRGAMPNIFENAIEENHTIELTTNFRSAREINDFVGKVCNSGFFEDHKAAIQTNEENKDGGMVYFVDPYPIEPYEDYGYLVKLLKWIADNKAEDKTKNKSNGEVKSKYGQITVLSRTKKELIKLKKELLKYDIPFAFIEEEETYLNPEIIPLRAFLNILNDPQNDSAMLAYLTSLPFAINEDDIYTERKSSLNQSLYESIKNSENEEIKNAIAIFHNYLSLKKFMNTNDILLSFVKETKFLPKVAALENGENKYINVKRFIGQVKNLEESGFTLGDIVQYINTSPNITSKSLYENSEDSLKLMTIHKSKGLENDIIVYLNPYSISKPKDSLAVGIKDGKYILTIKKFFGDKDNEIKSIKNENIHEEQRLFYVGITRAKKYLFLVNQAKKPTTENILLDQYLHKEMDKNGNLKSNGEWDEETIKEIGEYLKREVITDVKIPKLDTKENKITFKEIKTTYTKDYTNLSYKKFNSPTYLYKFQEILEETEEEPHIVFQEEEAKEDGIAVHSLLEHLMVGESLKGIIDKYFDSEIGGLDEKDKIKKHLQEWIGSEEFNRIETSKESYNEFKVDKAFKIGDRDFVLTGVIDKIYKDENGKWVIVDYKFSTKRNIEKYKFQLHFYAYCLKDILDIENVRLIFLKNKPEKGVFYERFEDIDFNTFESDLRNKIKHLSITIGKEV